MHDRAVARERRAGEHLVLPVDGEIAFHDRGLQEIEQIAGVHLARMVGKRGREVDGTDHLHAVVQERLARARELAIAALLRGETEEAALVSMLASPEFYARAASLSGAGTADQRYVAALYSLLLHRTVTIDEANLWAPALANAGTAAVAAGFVYSSEFRLDDVGADYATLLHRQTPPSAAELAFWAVGPLDLTSIRVGIEASLEYFLNG